MAGRDNWWLRCEVMSIEEELAVCKAMHDRWVAQAIVPPPLNESDSGWADLAAAAICTLRNMREAAASGIEAASADKTENTGLAEGESPTAESGDAQ